MRGFGKSLTPVGEVKKTVHPRLKAGVSRWRRSAGNSDVSGAGLRHSAVRRQFKMLCCLSSVDIWWGLDTFGAEKFPMQNSAKRLLASGRKILTGRSATVLIFPHWKSRKLQ